MITNYPLYSRAGVHIRPAMVVPAGPAAAGGLALLRRGGEVRPRILWVRGHQGQQRPELKLQQLL